MDILRVDTLSLTLILSVLVLVCALIWRHKAGFGYGKTISHDNVRLSSERCMLRGKPDRIVQRGRYFIPEEKKSGLRPAESYQAQLGVYLILIEQEWGAPTVWIPRPGGRQTHKGKKYAQAALSGHRYCEAHTRTSPLARRTPAPSRYSGKMPKLPPAAKL